MNLFFVYKNQTFDFEIKTDVSIMSLKNMVSKILEKDRNSFDLFYNNKIISEKESSLYKITKGEKNVGIIVMLKRNNKNNKKNKKLDLPFLTSANQKNTIKIENDSIDNDLNLNETEIFSSSSTKKLNSYLKHSQKNHIMSKEKKIAIKILIKNRIQYSELSREGIRNYPTGIPIHPRRYSELSHRYSELSQKVFRFIPGGISNYPELVFGIIPKFY